MTQNNSTENDSFTVNTREQVSETSTRLIQEASRSINILLYDYDEVLLPASKIDNLLSNNMNAAVSSISVPRMTFFAIAGEN